MKSKLNLKGNNLKKLFIIVFLVIAILLATNILISKTKPLKNEIKQEKSYPIIEVKIKDKTFKSRIADTPQKREEGLMFVKDMPEDEGMLFIYSQEDSHTFWMKNTYIPLDIIFVNAEKKIIKIHSNAKPLDTSVVYPSLEPSMYVLEINGGIASKYGIKEGDTLSF